MSETPGSVALTWIARIWSLAGIGFVLVFVIGELVEGHGPAPTKSEWIGISLFPVGVALGLAIAWWRKLPGGLIAIGSIIAFYFWSLLERGKFPGGPYFLLIAAPGILFICSSLLSSSRHQTRSA